MRRGAVARRVGRWVRREPLFATIATSPLQRCTVSCLHVGSQDMPRVHHAVVAAILFTSTSIALGTSEVSSADRRTSCLEKEIGVTQCGTQEQVCMDCEAALRHEFWSKLAVLPGPGQVAEDLLLRCCRAERGETAAARRRLQSNLEWRAVHGIDKLLEDPEALAHEQECKEVLHYSLTGWDRRGRPVMVQAVGLWDLEAVDLVVREQHDEFVRSHLVVVEVLLRQARQAVAAERAEGRSAQVSGWVGVFDLEGFSLRVTAYPAIRICLAEIRTLFLTYHPDAVDDLFIVNAPPSFYVLWHILCRILRADTRARVHVLPRGDFRALVHDCGGDCLPEELGGNLPRQTPPYGVVNSPDNVCPNPVT